MKYPWIQPLSGDPNWYYNQTARFHNASDLVEYVCSHTTPNWFVPMQETPEVLAARPMSYHDNYNWEPICPFPYVPKGWGYDKTTMLLE